MQESYGEDQASHSDPASCTIARKDGREALTGACAGGLWSREIILVRGARNARWGQVLQYHIPGLTTQWS
jgi:hypothetical protein